MQLWQHCYPQDTYYECETVTDGVLLQRGDPEYTKEHRSGPCVFTFFLPGHEVTFISPGTGRAVKSLQPVQRTSICYFITMLNVEKESGQLHHALQWNLTTWRSAGSDHLLQIMEGKTQNT